MKYHPQYCTIVVRNTDGSGYLRQFKTLAEAKDAYASISASGAAVYLYQPPTKSLASFEAGANVPDYNNGVTYGTGDQVKFQGKVYQLNNFIGAAGYTPASHPNQWTEVSSFTPPNVPPISSTASAVVEDGLPRSPFGFNQDQNSTPAKMTKIGCEISNEREADGYYRFCSIYPKYRYTLPDGTILSEEIGAKDTNGCHYPAGFKLERENGPFEFYRETKTLYSLDFGGNTYGPYHLVDAFLGSTFFYKVADGNGGSNVQRFVGIQKFEDNEWKTEYLQDGDTPYRLSNTSLEKGINWTKLGLPIPNGNYIVTYKVTGDDKIHTGMWNVSVVNAGSSPRTKWVFTPQEPDQPPPLPCSITKKVENSFGNLVDICDPDVIYPFTVEENCEPPLTVVLEGQTVTLGTNKKTGMDNGYGDVVWGPCSGMVYVANGTLVLSGTDLNYFSDGEGSYYTENKNPDPCLPSGSVISNEQTDITVEINAGNYTVGYSYERTVADGNCSSSLEIGSEYLPNGTLITEDSDNKYYSNGIGGYYAEPITPEITGYEGEEDRITVAGSSVVSRTRTRPQYSNGSNGEWSEWNYTPNGTFYTSDESYNYYANGSGGYYSEPKQQQCDPSGTQISSDSGNYTVNVGCEDWVTGNWSSATYADGSCGTYTNGGANYVSNGQYLGNCNDYNYYANGSGGYYQGEYTGTPSCDSYGTWVDGNSSDITVNNPCGGTWTVGYSTYSVYADGNCGTYSESGSNYKPNGEYLGNCNDYNYYSSGNGEYYQGEYTGTPSYEPYGTPTGNTSNGGNMITINDASYDNGGYYATEYHDGNGGYYNEYIYEYTSYGYYFGSQSYYDYETMMDIYTYYYSDGNGGYYTSY